jgi:vacuolar protein sorting-associated protein 26
MANFLQNLLGPLCSVETVFTPSQRPPVTVKGENGRPETLQLYTANDTVSGEIHITPAPGKKVEHQGMKVELLGTIELFFDRGNTYDFCAMGTPLAGRCGRWWQSESPEFHLSQCASWSRLAS